MYQNQIQYRGFHYLNCRFNLFLIISSMQRPGTEAIRNQIQPSKTKREITKITNSQNEKEHMVNRVSSYFPKGGYSATKI